MVQLALAEIWYWLLSLNENKACQLPQETGKQNMTLDCLFHRAKNMVCFMTALLVT
jgi:hypothetical protein